MTLKQIEQGFAGWWSSTNNGPWFTGRVRDGSYHADNIAEQVRDVACHAYQAGVRRSEYAMSLRGWPKVWQAIKEWCDERRDD